MKDRYCAVIDDDKWCVWDYQTNTRVASVDHRAPERMCRNIAHVLNCAEEES